MKRFNRFKKLKSFRFEKQKFIIRYFLYHLYCKHSLLFHSFKFKVTLQSPSMWWLECFSSHRNKPLFYDVHSRNKFFEVSLYEFLIIAFSLFPWFAEFPLNATRCLIKIFLHSVECVVFFLLMSHGKKNLLFLMDRKKLLIFVFKAKLLTKEKTIFSLQCEHITYCWVNGCGHKMKK